MPPHGRRSSAGILAGALAAAVLLVVPRLDAQPPDRDRRVALFARYVDALRVQAGIPGISGTVIAGDQVLWEGGFGFADVEGRIPAAPDTPYRIASLTKTFASTLLMQCRDAGTLDLDTAIRNYTPAIPEAPATVRHVLSMTSEAPPGSQYRYDGNRYATLTAVVAACTGEAYRTALA